MKKWMLIICIFIAIFYFIASLGLLIPGMGLESKMFIDSVRKQLKIMTPKNKYVLNPKSALYEPIMLTVVKNSYIADAISTINHDDDNEYNELNTQYRQFSNEWFHKKWDKIIAEKTPIDFYDIGNDIIEFDMAIAQKYQSYGYVNTGIQWVFHKDGISDIFSNKLKQKSKRQQGLIEQEEYDARIESTKPGLTGITVSYSPGTLLKNNKAWFVNQQIDSLKYALSIKGLENPFIDTKLKASDLPEHITPDVLYSPNFIRGQIITQIAFIMLCSSVFITPTVVIFSTTKLIKNKRRK
ncbi:hypothetical protein [Mesoplasma corruscae]|uniref:Uncharacterized protein n=1 Tax=Mesoplasma corruscae TaxID=216874 RepID=A0A2S5RG82_9MOLU|nr:hypothetical protein [Mesoplasma corruscae]PPE06339.1 hypothetical protein MCORR_v1c06440 [Mesoplasma corruscae]